MALKSLPFVDVFILSIFIKKYALKRQFYLKNHKKNGIIKYNTIVEKMMQEKIWEYRNKQLKTEDIMAFAKRHSLPLAVAVILLNRGISDEGVEAYIKKGLDSIHNPFMLNDMEIAVDRIIDAVEGKEKIIIYGDYDVDGITATATLYKFLKGMGADVDYYIPDRFSEGYGINIMAVNRLARAGVNLMITVDCGVTAVGEVAFAKTQGMDVVITDHHTCKDELPDAVAVINPKRQDSQYNFSGLAGVGVAFKLVLALAIRLGMNTKDVFLEYADLVAIGTIADVVSLVDENRTIVSRGIKIIENTKNVGIQALLEVSGIKGKIVDSTSLAFSVAPRLNVAGRLESAKTAVELLVCNDKERAYEIAHHLDETNKNRQAIEKKIYEEALAMAEEFESKQLVYVLSGEGWHHGVIGIVASKLCEKLYRPCILISCEDGKGKGSARSVPEMNLFDALSDSEDILTQFGGHSQAAGLSINADKINEFREKINVYAKKNVDIEELVPKLKIDCNLKGESITLNAAKTLSYLEPFGEGNETPVFSACGLKVISASSMGQDGKHLRIRLTDGNSAFTAVGFGMGEILGDLNAGDVVNIAFSMNVNLYQGTENLQLILKDIKK